MTEAILQWFRYFLEDGFNEDEAYEMACLRAENLERLHAIGFAQTPAGKVGA